jgi:hypothetical protein
MAACPNPANRLVVRLAANGAGDDHGDSGNLPGMIKLDKQITVHFGHAQAAAAAAPEF